MQELDQMKVEFGTKHLGKTFIEVWNTDQPWVMWFVKHYQSSSKAAHRLLIQYVELKVERAELEGEMISVQEPSPQLHKKNPIEESGKSSMGLMAKAKARPETHVLSEGITDWDIDILSEGMIRPPVEVQQLSDRMGHLENAIQTIMNHLEMMAVQQGQVSVGQPDAQ